MFRRRLALILWSLAVLLHAPVSGAGAERGTGLGASHIVLDPRNPDVVYVSSTLYGVYKSTDGGRTWRLTIQGVGAPDFYALAIHPRDSRVLFVGAAGGGIYRSDDGGEAWREASVGLSDTSVYDILFDPRDPAVIYALTLREVFRSTNGGLSWGPVFRDQRTITDSSYHRRLFLIPGEQDAFLIGTGERGYRRGEGEGQWAPLGSRLEGLKVTAFAYRPATRTLYAGAVFADGLYQSVDGGVTWTLVGGGLKNVWVHRIVLDPVNPQVIYLATKNKGMLKSEDGGASWHAINDGLSEIDIKALAIHPVNPQILYAGTYGRGIFTSSDGGGHWINRPVPPFPTWGELNASLTRKVQAMRQPPPPPEAFRKCQTCHAWTDPILNGPTKQTFWRVFPSPRDWSETMDRMKTAAQLTAPEYETISQYLNTYYRAPPSLPSSQQRRLELPVFAGKDCYPTNLVAADLNADGWPDLAVTGFCNRFAVFFADPKRPGTFLPPREIRVPTSAIGMAVLPRKTKGPPLIVVSNCANPDAIPRQPLLHVVSMENFEVIETIPSGGKAPDDIAVADFNSDGLQDLVVGHWKEGVLSLLLGQEREGKFRVPTNPSPQRVVVGDEHWQVVARDFDRDGKMDVAFPVWTFRGGEANKKAELVVFRGDGRGGLDPVPLKNFPLDKEARSLAVADFDRNGTLDIAVANPGSGLREDGGILLLSGDGAGDFRPVEGSEKALGLLAPQGIAAADLDGDGSPDLVVASRPVTRDGQVTILYNDGVGHFSLSHSQALSFGPQARVSNLSFQPLITADLDRDGAPEIIVANNEGNTISIFFNQRPH